VDLIRTTRSTSFGVLWHRGDTLEIGFGVLAPVSHATTRGVLAHVVCEFGGHHDAK
jgi:hypothetical protein